MPEADYLTTFMCWMSWKSGSLNLLETSGPHRACYEAALPIFFTLLHGISYPDVRLRNWEIPKETWRQAVTCLTHFFPVLSTQRPRFRSQLNIIMVCGGMSGTVTGFSSGISGFSYQNHYTNAPCSLIYLLSTIRYIISVTKGILMQLD